ncbi:hypothetical protein HMPREF1142_1727 [Peptostreptococcaceae bacterium AS15]|nr:hypothetical protein HMPREF1142_1727 [Peptostreptococcaceae bacterium AS15]
MKKIKSKIKNMIDGANMQKNYDCDLKELNVENNIDLVSDEELEKTFGGNMVIRARWTITSKCPSSIGHCC